MMTTTPPPTAYRPVTYGPDAIAACHWLLQGYRVCVSDAVLRTVAERRWYQARLHHEHSGASGWVCWLEEV